MGSVVLIYTTLQNLNDEVWEICTCRKPLNSLSYKSWPVLDSGPKNWNLFSFSTNNKKKNLSFIFNLNSDLRYASQTSGILESMHKEQPLGSQRNKKNLLGLCRKIKKLTFSASQFCVKNRISERCGSKLHAHYIKAKTLCKLIIIRKDHFKWILKFVSKYFARRFTSKYCIEKNVTYEAQRPLHPLTTQSPRLNGHLPLSSLSERDVFYGQPPSYNEIGPCARELFCTPIWKKKQFRGKRVRIKNNKHNLMVPMRSINIYVHP